MCFVELSYRSLLQQMLNTSISNLTSPRSSSAEETWLVQNCPVTAKRQVCPFTVYRFLQQNVSGVATFWVVPPLHVGVNSLVVLLLQKLDQDWGGPLAQWLLTSSHVTSAPIGYQSSTDPQDWLLTPKEKLQVSSGYLACCINVSDIFS